MSDVFTPEDLIENLRDPWFRITNLYAILDESAKIVPFVPRVEQIQFYRNQRNRNFILKARKLGMSTLLVLQYLDACIFSPGTHAAIVDRSQKEAEDKLQIARLAWENMPRMPSVGAQTIGAKIHERLELERDSDGEMVFSNGSRFEAGVSLRGGTPQLLHVSELGYIASHDRKRAEEIKAGSINAVPASGSVTIETTHEGGKVGINYEFAKLAMDCSARGEKTPLDWQFFFFPWYEHPSYTFPPGAWTLSPSTREYFAKLKEAYAIELSVERMAWYQAKTAEQKEAMYREFPTVPDEAFRAIVSGAIYPAMMTLRAAGRISDFEPDPNAPLLTSWDIGISDFTDIWLLQFAGREILWLDWIEGEGRSAGSYVDDIRRWEQRFNRVIAQHFLPHDAERRELSSGKSVRQALQDAGLGGNSIRVVPRIPDVWQGINALRALLPRSWFHSRCDLPRRLPDGTEKLSGVGCLEAYHKKGVSSSGTLHEMPVHDETSHASDGARTIAEAYEAGLIDVRSGPEASRNGRKTVVVTGTGSNQLVTATGNVDSALDALGVRKVVIRR